MPGLTMNTLKTGSRQRGVGTVLVVMVLFFVVSLMAAYTSRNLIFEQKTSANQTRATMAFEAADAGIEWTLAQLNGGLINDSCEDGTPGADNSFQQRYLSVNANGDFTRATRAVDSWPTCVFNGTDWTCRCPNGTADTPPDSVGTGPAPSFRVWPATTEPTSPTSSPYAPAAFPRPAIISLASAGCSVLPANANLDSMGGAVASNSNCLSFLPRAGFGEGLGTARVYLGLRSGLVSPPSVPLTVRGAISTAPGLAKLRVINRDKPSDGYTVNTSEVVNPARFEATSVDGTPGSASFIDQDSRLQFPPATGPAPLSSAERMFVAVFGMKRQTYRDQPGLRVCNSPCTSALINDLLDNNPHRIIWVEGALTLDANIGTTDAPVLLIVNSDTLTLGTGVQIIGFVYMAGAASTINLPVSTPAPSIAGALVTEGSLTASYASTPAPGQEFTILYDPVSLNLLRTTYGSWVRVVGSWRDFKEGTP
jgi:Tfp pilus assembly protein PilX